MTNNEIIIAEALEHGIYTQEQVDEFLDAGQGCVPLHSYEGWLYLGYRPRRGTHACVVTKLWKLVPEKKDDDGHVIEDSHYILTKTHLFSAEQVEPKEVTEI